MNDQELRALVRDAVARHMGRSAAPPPVQSMPPVTIAPPAHDPSHGVYITLTNATDACVIEPSVKCNHCNYCRSHGH